MKVLVATHITQGDGKGDYCWAVDGELVTPLGLVCSNSKCGWYLCLSLDNKQWNMHAKFCRSNNQLLCNSDNSNPSTMPQIA